MSALASSFSSWSFTLDVYKEFYPDASKAQLVRAGRWVAVLSRSSLWVQLISMMDGTSGSEKGLFFGQLHEPAWTCTAS